MGIEYKADIAQETFEVSEGAFWKYILPGGRGIDSKWRPSIFMPRWASRILLEITEVRAERLQEITEEDAVAEGVKSYYTLPSGETTARYHFSVLWDSLNAKCGYGWDKNPWVWVISFKLMGQLTN